MENHAYWICEMTTPEKQMTNIKIFSMNNEQLFQLLLRRTKDSISTELEGETVILHLTCGTYSGLDALGTFIWKRLEHPVTIEALRDAILQEYAVSEEQCVADLLEFLRDLADNGLLAIGS
jgi:Coenzyme PQQ synthesis protein D (PqqD)